MLELAITFFADIDIHPTNRVNFDEIRVWVSAELGQTAVAAKMIGIIFEFVVMLGLIRVH